MWQRGGRSPLEALLWAQRDQAVWKSLLQCLASVILSSLLSDMSPFDCVAPSSVPTGEEGKLS